MELFRPASGVTVAGSYFANPGEGGTFRCDTGRFIDPYEPCGLGLPKEFRIRCE